MKYVEKFGSSPKELERKAAIKVLGFVSDSDSCLDMIKENIELITKYIVSKLQDPSVILNVLLIINSLWSERQQQRQ
jgi:hypothetical protein